MTSIDNSSAVALGGSGNEEDAKQTCPVCQKRVKYVKVLEIDVGLRLGGVKAVLWNSTKKNNC